MDPNFSIAKWAPLFGAEVGATAALAGLLFVALSINITRILQYPWLPARAAKTLVVMVGALVESSVVLIPDQSHTALGWEIMAIGTATWLFAMLLTYTTPQSREVRKFEADRILFQFAIIPGIVGGSLIAHSREGGLFLLTATVLLSLVIAVINSWVLLVEILR